MPSANLDDPGTDELVEVAGLRPEIAGAMHELCEAMAELGRALLELGQWQTRHNLEAWTRLVGAVQWNQIIKAADWDRVLQVQSEYLRVSLDRMAQLSQQCLEISQAVVAVAADPATQKPTKRAA